MTELKQKTKIAKRQFVSIEQQIRLMYQSAIRGLVIHGIPQQLRNRAYIAGGFYSSFYCPQNRDSDIDVFFRNKQDSDAVKDVFVKNGSSKEIGHTIVSSDYVRPNKDGTIYQIHESQDDWGLIQRVNTVNINYIFFNYGQPQQLISKFDFKHSMSYYDGTNLVVKYPQHSINKRLQLNDVRLCRSIRTCDRFVKFARFGYSFEPRDFLSSAYDALTIDLVRPDGDGGTDFYGHGQTQVHLPSMQRMLINESQIGSHARIQDKFRVCAACQGYGHSQGYPDRSNFFNKNELFKIQCKEYPKYLGRCLACSGCGLIQKYSENNDAHFSDQHRKKGMMYQTSRGYTKNVITQMNKVFKQYIKQTLLVNQDEKCQQLMKGMTFCIKRGLDPYIFVHGKFNLQDVVILAKAYLIDRNMQAHNFRKAIKVLQNV